MKRSFSPILAVLFLAVAGCNRDSDKGIMQHKDKPADHAPAKAVDKK